MVRGSSTTSDCPGRGPQRVARSTSDFLVASRTVGPDEEALAIDLIQAVRDAIGPHVDLLVEGHCRFGVAQAIRFAERMAPSNPLWFEEPVPHQDPDSVVEVALHSPVPIATGESFASAGSFAALLRRGGVRIWQPDPMHLGGAIDAPAHPPGEPLGEMPDQPRDVVFPLAQRRHFAGHHVQPIEEIVPKAARGDFGPDVLVGRVVVEDLIEDPFEGAIGDDREDAERPVIQLIGRDVAREVGECPVEVLGPGPPRRLFPPRPRPSSGSWHKEQTRGARARGSSRRCDRVGRPR